ncbi:MAG: hypothetical protein IK121_00190 [Lachnospiraceae bacterium]|nr:hypothetical protein [Lachnospiraceae bacterium]
MVDLHQARPKDKDLVWEVRNNINGRWYLSEKPPYETDMDDVKEVQITKNEETYEQLSLF